MGLAPALRAERTQCRVALRLTSWRPDRRDAGFDAVDIDGVHGHEDHIVAHLSQAGSADQADVGRGADLARDAQRLQCSDQRNGAVGEDFVVPDLLQVGHELFQRWKVGLGNVNRLLHGNYLLLF